MIIMVTKGILNIDHIYFILLTIISTFDSLTLQLSDFLSGNYYQLLPNLTNTMRVIFIYHLHPSLNVAYSLLFSYFFFSPTFFSVY